ncbi:MAG: single-stranded DNA-binding protein [Oscillospiraceae bacterium]|jgi:single-strand DNA-binding protein|nr:single-stranded DNA-binding protein [Oscillospiraceae bacterium]
MLNRIVLMGRLTKDPELRHTQSGHPVASFTLACERDYRPQGEERATDFLDIVAWRNTAEFTSKWFRKGQLVAVSGRLQTRKWQDKEGNNRTSYEVVIDDAYFAEKRGDGPSAPYEIPPRPGAPESVVELMPAPSSFAELEDDGELPF